MTRDIQWNGEVRYAVRKHHRGIAERFGLDPHDSTEHVVRARITPLLVRTDTRCYNRLTGEERYGTRGSKVSRLVAYQLAGKEWVGVSSSEQKPSK
jgi:hypothetical protein